MVAKRGLTALLVVVLTAICSCSRPYQSVVTYLGSPSYLQAILQDGKWGYADGARMVIRPQFDEARAFAEGFAPVRDEGGWHYIDAAGRKAFKRAFDDARSFSEGMAAVRVEGQWGFIDRSGKVAIPIKFLAARHFHYGLAPVLVGDQPDTSGSSAVSGKWGYIDRQGRVLIPPRFDDAYSFSEGMARVNIGGRQEWWGKGPRALLTMIEGGKWGYIDRSGEMVIAAYYDWASDYSEGLAAVMVGNEWGYADPSGNLVVTPRFDAAYDFFDGKANAEIGDKELGLIKINGRLVCAGTRTNPAVCPTQISLPLLARLD